MSRPENRENLKSLADQLVWAINEYVAGGLDDIKGDDWDSNISTLQDIGVQGTHDTDIFPDATNLTVTLTANVADDAWSAWAEIADSGATTFSSKITSDAHITGIYIEDTSVSGETWMLEISYGEDKHVVSTIRFITASLGGLPATTGVRTRSDPIPSGETVYARLMCGTGGETCKIHIRYYLMP